MCFAQTEGWALKPASSGAAPSVIPLARDDSSP